MKQPDKQRLYSELLTICKNLQRAADWFEENDHSLNCRINYNDLLRTAGAIDYELRHMRALICDESKAEKKQDN